SRVSTRSGRELRRNSPPNSVVTKIAVRETRPAPTALLNDLMPQQASALWTGKRSRKRVGHGPKSGITCDVDRPNRAKFPPFPAISPLLPSRPRLSFALPEHRVCGPDWAGFGQNGRMFIEAEKEKSTNNLTFNLRCPATSVR